MVVEMGKEVLAKEKEIGRLRHHVLVLGKRKLGWKKKLVGVEGGKGKGEVVLEVAEIEIAVEEVVAEGEGQIPEADVVAESMVELDSGVSEMPDSVTSGDEGMRLDDEVKSLKDRQSDKYVVVDGKIVCLKRYTPVVSDERVKRVEALPPRAQLAMVGRGGGRGYLESVSGQGRVVFGVGIQGTIQGT